MWRSSRASRPCCCSAPAIGRDRDPAPARRAGVGRTDKSAARTWHSSGLQRCSRDSPANPSESTSQLFPEPGFTELVPTRNGACFRSALPARLANSHEAYGTYAQLARYLSPARRRSAPRCPGPRSSAGWSRAFAATVQDRVSRAYLLRLGARGRTSPAPSALGPECNPARGAQPGPIFGCLCPTLGIPLAVDRPRFVAKSPTVTRTPRSVPAGQRLTEIGLKRRIRQGRLILVSINGFGRAPRERLPARLAGDRAPRKASVVLALHPL